MEPVLYGCGITSLSLEQPESARSARVSKGVLKGKRADMLKFKLQNREANVCCQSQSHSHQKTFQVLLILLGASLLVGTTALLADLPLGDAMTNVAEDPPPEEDPLPEDPPAEDPPEIIDFESYPGYQDAWTFEGTVIDAEPGGLTIEFGDLLDGHSVTTDENGFFSYTVVLTEVGIVTAVTTDALGLESTVEEVFVEEF